MRYEWDENKRLANLKKHKLDFYRVKEVFEAHHVSIPSAYSGSESRVLTVGMLEGLFVTVIHTMRGEKIRIISMRRSRDEEKRAYRQLYE